MATGNQKMVWQDVSPFADSELVRFTEEGDSLIGTLKDIREGRTQHGVAKFADIETDDGKTVTFILSAGLLNLIRPDLIGRYVWVRYLGRQVNDRTGQEFKAFEVKVSAPADETDEPGEIPF